jgi:decaprenylphospho-beta-D-ribofuranose 2-oxidase
VASDIHGKNHGVDGSFGAHVEALTLLSARGELLELGPGDPVFDATLGGMGLTGIVLRARIRMRAVSSPLVSVDTDRVGDLDAALNALQAPGGRHRVAWLDLLGRTPARGIVTRAEHADAGAAPGSGGPESGATVSPRAAVPRFWPGILLRPSTVAAFNELRYRTAPRHAREHIEGVGRHMFPLDGLSAWPRLYGPHGFVQYQLVVPSGRERVLQAVIERLRRSRVPCYLAVLKDFGPAGAGPLSFPLPGWTLALDMPRSAPGLGELLRGFDELVIEAGGRVYLAKNPEIRAEALRAMYPRLGEWQAVRDRIDPERVWRSDMALRAGLVSS